MLAAGDMVVSKIAAAFIVLAVCFVREDRISDSNYIKYKLLCDMKKK